MLGGNANQPACLLTMLLGIAMAGATPLAQASGPMTHMMDGLYYMDEVSVHGPPDQAADVELIDESNSERYLLLGTMFPDVGTAIEGLGFGSHDRALAVALLEAADLDRELYPWKVAFARGYTQHICSDISAQLFQTQTLTISPGLGEVDLFDGMGDDHPGYENELLVEVAIDFYYGDLNLLIDVLDYFILDRNQGDARFQMAVDFWYDTALETYGAGIISEASLEDQLDEYIRLVEKYQFVIREPMLNTILRRMRRNSLGELLEEVMSKADRYLSDQPDASLRMDLEELERLKDTPFFADRSYFSWYFEDFQWLGPAIHQQFYVDQLWYQDWPTWDPAIMQAAGIQGLAMAWPERFNGTWEIVVSAARFLDADTGQTVSTLSASSPPKLVRAELELFGTVPVAETVRVRVMRDLPSGYLSDEPCDGAEWEEALWLDPATYGDTPRPVIAVEFDPSSCVDGADGLYLEAILTSGSGEKPFYTSSWEAFEGIPDRDLTQAPYELMYAPASTRTGYVSVD